MNFLEPKLTDFLNYVFSLVTTNFVSVTTIIVFTLFGLGYTLFYIREIASFFVLIYPKSVRAEAREFFRDVYASMGRYIRVIFINAVIIGLSYWIVFEAFNLKYSAIISLWAFVTNFIPIVGVVLEYIPVLLFSLTLGVKGVLLIALFAILIHAVAFVVFIQLMKGLEKLNPVYIILSILFFGKLFGLFGSFVGVPLALFFKVFWRKFLRPLFEAG
jgi:predicted PurR-regulated permease PerM